MLAASSHPRRTIVLSCVAGLAVLLGPATRARSGPAPAPSVSAPAASELAQPPVAWEKIGDDDGIAVYRREVPGSPVIAFKGEGVMTHRSFAWQASSSTPRATGGSTALEARTLRHLEETDYIEYDHVGTPFVMKDRDFVIDRRPGFEPAAKKATLSFTRSPTCSPRRLPCPRRAHQHGFAMTALEHGTKTQLVAEIHCDPKGSVAKWIVNWFQKAWPHNTITRLRAQAAKPDIVDHARLKEIMTEKGYFN
jgi:hypothetical protein